MGIVTLTKRPTLRRNGRRLAAGAAALALATAAAPAAALALASGTQPAAAAGAGTDHTAAQAKPPAAALLEQCVTAVSQTERSATFTGEMTAVPGTARMQMRIEVLERPEHETVFHAVSYPGLGSWLRASPGVKTYRNLDRVTDLSAPAAYRAAIHFRWLNARGRVIKALELRTPRCEQPAAAAALAPVSG
jgi:hypothetical protein